MIDIAPTLLDANTLPKISKTMKVVAHTDKSVKDSEYAVLVQKYKDAKEQNRKLKKRYEITVQKDLKSGRLEQAVNSIRFIKNGDINKKKLSEHYGCTDKTILNLSV